MRDKAAASWSGMGCSGCSVGGNLGRRVCKAGRCRATKGKDWLLPREGFTTQWLSQPQSSSVHSPQKYLLFGLFPESLHNALTLAFRYAGVIFQCGRQSASQSDSWTTISSLVHNHASPQKI